MSSVHRFRVVLDGWRAVRVWKSWSRSCLVSLVLKRCSKERGVREVLQCFRQTFLRQRRTLMLAVTAAVKKDDDEKDDDCFGEDSNITDEELESLVSEIDEVEELSLRTLFCRACGRRLVVSSRLPHINYCNCKKCQAPPSDEWEPFMEADDVIIWRKEYKKGQGLYAYKVYGRYDEVVGSDFASVQTDSVYRPQWDAAVATLRVLQPALHGVPRQDLVYWEVVWPRMFANRDYVFVRRFKDFDIKSKAYTTDKGLFPICQATHRLQLSGNTEIEKGPSQEGGGDAASERDGERLTVHSRARRKSSESSKKRPEEVQIKHNKVYIIASRSCAHHEAPPSGHCVRVTEYWSHMVIRTTKGHDQAGMEFVLTYYDEPCVGVGSNVAAWASGRAAPDYLATMRRAARDYGRYADRQDHDTDKPPPLIIEHTSPQAPTEESTPTAAAAEQSEAVPLSAQDESPAAVAELAVRDQSTQTEDYTPPPLSHINSSDDLPSTPIEVSSKTEEEDNGEIRWWKYLYPFYYFI